MKKNFTLFSLIVLSLIPSTAWASYDCGDRYLGMCAGVGVDILAIPTIIFTVQHYRKNKNEPQSPDRRMLFVVLAYAVYFIALIYFIHNLATGGSCNPMVALKRFLFFGMLFPVAMLVHSVFYLAWKIRG